MLKPVSINGSDGALRLIGSDRLDILLILQVLRMRRRHSFTVVTVFFRFPVAVMFRVRNATGGETGSYLTIWDWLLPVGCHRVGDHEV